MGGGGGGGGRGRGGEGTGWDGGGGRGDLHRPNYSNRPVQRWGAAEPQPPFHGHQGPEEREQKTP